MEASFDLTLKDLEATISFGKTLGRFMGRGQVLALTGELGAGKTTLVKAIALGVGVAGNDVCSPSYTLVNEYEGRIPLYHFDLYRLEGAEDVSDLGFEEYLEGDGLCVIEWADIAPEILPEDYMKIRIEVAGEAERKFLVSGRGGVYSGIVERLKHQFGGVGAGDL